MNGKPRRAIKPSPRTIDSPIAMKIVAAICDSIALKSGQKSEIISKAIEQLLPTLLPPFQGYIPFKSLTFSDQYYFSLWLYAAYRIAEQVIPESTDRVAMRQDIGDRILNIYPDVDFVSSPEKPNPIGSAKQLGFAIEKILAAMTAEGFLASSIFDSDDLIDAEYVAATFNDVRVSEDLRSCRQNSCILR